MRFSDHEWIAATPRQTWNALHDPAALQYCLHDCRSVTRRPDNGVEIVFDTSANDATSQFEGTILVESSDAPRQLHVVFNGAGPHTGLAIGHAKIDLEAGQHGGTRLGYQLEAAAGGALARLGAEELDRRARHHLQGFFLRLNEVAQRQPGADPVEPPPPASGGKGIASWLLALIVLGVVVGYFVLLRP